MGVPISPRLNLDDLLVAARVATPRELAWQTGVSVRQVNRWFREGGIPARSADRVACAAGLNPINVWGDDWETAPS